MLGKGKLFILLLWLTMCLSSCTKDIDFDQANNFQVSPVLESSLIFLNEPASQFIENGEELATIQDEVLITIFNDQFIQDNLQKAEFVFEISNSINRGYSLRVEFLDEIDQLLHVMSIQISASTNNQPILQTHIETFEGTSLLALMNTKKMDFTLNLEPGEPLTENSPGEIILKSKGVFYFNIDSSL